MGGDAVPLDFFVLKLLPNRLADHARILHTYFMGHPLHNAWRKTIDRVRSDHGAMTS